MQTTTTQAETPDLSPILQEGETALWSESRQRAMDHAIPPLLLSAVVLLTIYGLMVWESLSPGGLGKDNTLSMLFIPALALLCVLLAVLVARRNRRTVYVLTQRRAIICRRGIRKWRIDYDAPIARDLIHTLFREADGSADYIFKIYRSRYLQLPTGFIGVRSIQALESQFTRCGVKIPKPQSNSTQAVKPPSASRLFFVLATFAALLIFCIYESKTDSKLMLTLHGKPATATIVAHGSTVVREARGSGGPLRRYHPVLQFSPAPGSIINAVDLLSDEAPAGKPGDQVEILYHPQKPTLAMRATSSRFQRPAILLAMLLGLLGSFLNGLRRRYLHRRR